MSSEKMMWETPRMCIFRLEMTRKEVNEALGFGKDYMTDFIKWANDKPEDYKKWYFRFRQKAPARIVILSCLFDKPIRYTLPNIGYNTIDELRCDGDLEVHKKKRKASELEKVH
jgi:hypothetical protein